MRNYDIRSIIPISASDAITFGNVDCLMKNIESERLESLPLWKGEPYQGIYLRPGDLPQTIVCFIFGSTIGYFSYEDDAWVFLFVILLFLFYACIGRFLHDAAIRKRISYELWPTELLVFDKPRKSTVRSIPISQLEGLRPAWQGQVASIVLPLESGNEIFSVFNEWNTIIPSLKFYRRIELMENPDKVIEIISHYTKNITKP